MNSILAPRYIVLALVLFAAPIECRYLLGGDSKSGFITFLEVKCTDSSPENFIQLVKGADTQKECINECDKKEGCNLATYDMNSKDCTLFRQCGEPFEHKFIDDINDVMTDEIYDVEGFVTFGRVGANGYFVTPPGSYCKKTTGNSKKERKCDVIKNGEDSHFYTDSLEDCIQLCDSTSECIEGTWIPDQTPTRCRLLKNPGGVSLFLSRGPTRVTFVKERPTRA